MLLELLVVAIILAVIAVVTVLIKLFVAYLSVVEITMVLMIVGFIGYLALVVYLSDLIQTRESEGRPTFRLAVVTATLVFPPLIGGIGMLTLAGFYLTLDILHKWI